MSSKNIHDEISRCIIKMLVDEPFYAHFLSGIVRKVTDEVPTAAVGLNKTKVTLYVNESFFLKELKVYLANKIQQTQKQIPLIQSRKPYQN